MRPIRNGAALLCAIFLLVVMSACSTPGAVDAQKLVAGDGTPEERIARLEKAAASDKKMRGEWLRQRDIFAGQFVFEGDQLRRQGQLDQAQSLFERALKIDKGNIRAREGLQAIEGGRRRQKVVQEADKLFQAGDQRGASERLAEVLREEPNHRDGRALAKRIAEAQMAARESLMPQLNAALSKPITMEFRDASIGSVFELISRTSGVNFVFDRDVRPDTKVNVFVRNTSVDDVIKIILLTNQLERKILNDNTVLIYPNTPAKSKDYQDLVVRSFYLGNSDPKQVLAMLKTIMRARDVYIDEKLNLLIMRDTPQALKLAEKLISAQDLAEPEVMLDVEVLEIGQGTLQNLGMTYPESISYGNFGGGTPPGSIALSGNAFKAWVTNPALVLNIKRQDTTTRVLANPRIRVKNREKAKIHVGEKVPVVTTTSTANVGISSSVSYIDVGLKLDVEPNVYLDDDISIKVNLEVSNILEQIPVKDVFAFRLGTRNATTTLRLHDGETQVLAGLINDEDRRTASKVPGLGDMPILGRLFANNNDTRNKTEVVLLITPRVVRNLIRPDASDSEVYSGTDAQAGVEALRMKPTPPGSVSVAPGGAGGMGPNSSGGGASPRPAPGSPQPMPSASPQGAAPQNIPQATPLPPTGQALTLNAPANVKPGEEFVVSLKSPFLVVQGQLQVAFDWKSFTFVSATVPVQAVPGLVAVLVDNSSATALSAELVFKVTEKPPEAQSQLVVDGAQFFDEAGELIQVPPGPPVVIKINKTNGK